MKKIAVYFFISVLLLFVLVLSCSKDTTEPEPEEQETIIADNVTVFEEGGDVTLESIDSTTFTFSYVGDAPDIETGDILVGGEYGGYFRKASAVTSQDNQLIIETEDAALVEAILQGSFHITDTLDWNDANLLGGGSEKGKISGGDGVELLPNGTIGFSNLQIFSDDYLDISISEGSISFNPIIDIGGDIDFPAIFREFHALATGTVDVYADFYSISSRDYTISNEITIPGAQYEFGPFHIMIGFVPLWYSYELSLVAGFYYSSGAALETQHGFRNIASLTVGARYEDGDWDAVFDPRLELTDREVIWDKSDNVTLKCYIKPTLTMRFYSFLGPYLDAGPFLTLNGEVNYPQWQYDLNAGLESSLGFNVRFLSFELDAFNTVLYADSVTIASESGSAPSNSPPNPPSNPSPPDNSEDQSVNTIISWSCSDPDSGDILSYDVYFGVNSSPPLVSSNQSQMSHDPGELYYATEYFWKIIAKDEHNDTTASTIWSFTTEEQSGDINFVGRYETNMPTFCVHVAGDYAYLTEWQGNPFQTALLIIDISNPSNPNFVSRTYLPTSGFFRLTICVEENYVYIAEGSLFIIDISNVTNPTLAGIFDTTGAIGKVFVSGPTVYAAAQNGAFFQIINSVNPTDPVLIGSCDAPPNSQGKGVYISGSNAYVAGWLSGLSVIDITEPIHPTIVGNCGISTGAYDVFVLDDYAYVAAGTGGLQVVDVANLSNPSYVGSYDTPGIATDIHVEGNYAYIADCNGGLQILYVANPFNPTLAASYSGGRIFDLFVSGEYIYLPNMGLTIVRFVP